MTETPLIDAAGADHSPAGPDPRIVSLVPSLTELLFDLGLDSAVVGRTAYCCHPKGRVRTAMSVGGTKRVDMSKLEALEPTHIIVNVDETPKSLAEACADRGWSVVVTHPVAVGDVQDLFRLFGGIFGREAEARALVRDFDAALTDLRTVAQDLPRRRVLYLIWKEPWMTVSGDTWISRMLAEIRWDTQPSEAEVRYPEIAMDEPTLEGCDLVLFASEPFPFKPRHLEAFRTTFPRHAEKALAIDGELVSWYGSRAAAGLRYLQKLSTRIAPASAIG